jgi:hypothetical protein
MTAVANDSQPPDGELILRDLLEVWDHLERASAVPGQSVDAVRHATLVHGLAAHSVQLSRAVLVLMSDGLWVPSYPLVRLILEDAILAEWLESQPGSWRELLRPSAADLIRLVDQIAEHGTLTEGLRRYRAAAEANMDELGGRVSGRFTVERQMMDLAGAGKSLYTDYRILSQYCHAGRSVIDLYSVEDESVPGGITNLRQPKFELDPDERNAVIGYGAAGLLQTLLTWTRCTTDLAAQDRLRMIAKRLGVRDTPPTRVGPNGSS